MQNISGENKSYIKRLNVTLPPQLANFVGEITGENGLYETPSEFTRDLIRRYMEDYQKSEEFQINNMLKAAVMENDYSAYKADNAHEIRNKIN